MKQSNTECNWRIKMLKLVKIGFLHERNELSNEDIHVQNAQKRHHIFRLILNSLNSLVKEGNKEKRENLKAERQWENMVEGRREMDNED